MVASYIQQGIHHLSYILRMVVCTMIYLLHYHINVLTKTALNNMPSFFPFYNLTE